MDTSTRYARWGDLHIAYRTLGAGSVDLVLLGQWFSNLEMEWDVPPLPGSTTVSPHSGA